MTYLGTFSSSNSLETEGDNQIDNSGVDDLVHHSDCKIFAIFK